MSADRPLATRFPFYLRVYLFYRPFPFFFVLPDLSAGFKVAGFFVRAPDFPPNSDLLCIFWPSSLFSFFCSSSVSGPLHDCHLVLTRTMQIVFFPQTREPVQQRGRAPPILRQLPGKFWQLFSLPCYPPPICRPEKFLLFTTGPQACPDGF